MTNNYYETCEWLMDNGNPITRWRTATELIPDFQDGAELELALLENPLVKKWSERLPLGNDILEKLGVSSKNTPSEEMGRALVRLGQRYLHAAKESSFETVFEKCIGLGLTAGVDLVDKRILPFAGLLSGGRYDVPEQAWFHDSWRLTTAGSLMSYLVRMGFWTKEIECLARDHLRAQYPSARDWALDVYLKPDELSSILPPSWAKKMKDKSVMRPEYQRKVFPRWDTITTWAYAPADAVTKTDREQLDRIIEYVLDPEYQKLAGGYQTWDPERKTCYACGFGLPLPGFTSMEFSGAEEASGFIPSLVVMSKFERARKSSWFKNCLEYLESFKTADGVYRFPSELFPPHSPGRRWLLRLDENRRKKLGVELESTFWMMKIKKICK